MNAFGFGAAPGGDGGVVAGQQHVRYPAALPVGGAGVVGVFQQMRGEAFVGGAVGGAHDAGQQADDGVQHDQGGELAAGQHVVADGEFFHRVGVDDALVDAFVAAAEQDEAGGGGVALGVGLGEGAAARGEEHARAVVGDGGQRGVDHVGAHHHAGAAAERGVVHCPVPVGGEVADVDRIERPDAARQRPAGERAGERPREHLGEQGQHGGAPGHCGPLRTVRVGKPLPRQWGRSMARERRR